MRQQQKTKVHGVCRLNYALRKCVREWVIAAANTFLYTGFFCSKRHCPFGREVVSIYGVNIQFYSLLYLPLEAHLYLISIHNKFGGIHSR